MKKARLLLTAIFLVSTSGLCLAEESELGVSLDLTYMSRLMDKGGEYYSENGGFLETLDLDLWGTGFGVSVEHRESVGGSFVNKERYAYKLYYANTLFDDTQYLTKYKVYWKYNHHPDQARNIGNAQEWSVALSWPKLFDNGLVPSYAFYADYPAGSDYQNRKSSYFHHLFGLGYPLKVECLPNPLMLSGKVAYQDGGSTKDHDWSFATFGACSKFKVAENLSFTPGLYYQISMDDSVNRRDVLYTILSMKYSF